MIRCLTLIFLTALLAFAQVPLPILGVGGGGAGGGGGAVTSVFSRTGTVVAAEADYGLELLSDVTVGTTPPGTCTNNHIYVDTDAVANAALLICRSNAWTPIGIDGTGGVADPGANGYMVRTALNTSVARTFLGTANEVTVTNGDGTAGNSTLSLAATFDISGKTSTKPVKTGTAVPGTCGSGELFFDTDATAGENLYGCTSLNTWTLLGDGGGGGGVTNLYSMDDFKARRFTTTTTNDTLGVGQNCSASAPCDIVRGHVKFSTVAEITAQLTGTSSNGTVYVYLDGDGVMRCAENTAATLTGVGCTATVGAVFPANSTPLAAVSFTANAFDAITAAMSYRGAYGDKAVKCGAGMACAHSDVDGSVTLTPDASMQTITQGQTNSHRSNTTAGTSTAYTLDLPAGQDLAAYVNNVQVLAKMHATSGAAPVTLNVDGVGAKAIYKRNGTSAAAQATTGELILDQTYQFTYNTSLNAGAGGWETDIGGSNAQESTNPTNSGSGAAVLKTSTNVVARSLSTGMGGLLTQNTDDITVASIWGTGTAAPGSTDCDAAGEVGRFYLRTGDPASVPTLLYQCRQTGASSYAWHPAQYFVGTTLPATCAVGMVAFDSDATAGSNWYGCTAANTWTLLSGGGGGGAVRHLTLINWKTLPETGGAVFFETYPVKATNDFWKHGHYIFNNPAADERLYFSVSIPADYVGTASFKTAWTSTVTTGNLGIEFGYRCVAAGASLDQATAQETVNTTGTAPASTDLLVETSVNITSSNCASGNTMVGYFARDDSADTIAGAISVSDLLLVYSVQ